MTLARACPPEDGTPDLGRGCLRSPDAVAAGRRAVLWQPLKDGLHQLVTLLGGRVALQAARVGARGGQEREAGEGHCRRCMRAQRGATPCCPAARLCCKRKGGTACRPCEPPAGAYSLIHHAKHGQAGLVLGGALLGHGHAGAAEWQGGAQGAGARTVGKLMSRYELGMGGGPALGAAAWADVAACCCRQRVCCREGPLCRAFPCGGSPAHEDGPEQRSTRSGHSAELTS